MALTLQQIYAIHRSVKRRLRHVNNVCSIGFGCPRRRGRIDTSRGFSVCFYVRNKWDESQDKAKQNSSLRIPPHLDFQQRNERGPRRLFTDVVDLRKSLATGRDILVDGGGVKREATCGLLVKWKQDSRTKFGFFMVGHPFRAVATGHVIDVASSTGQFTVFGRLLARSATGSGSDLGLVEIREGSLVEIAPMFDAPPVQLATLSDLVGSLQGNGSIGPFEASLLRSDGQKAIRVGVFHPEFNIDGLGRVRNVLEATSPVSGTFKGGTSGAIWMKDNLVACIQTGAFFPDFRRGLGQVPLTQVAWLQSVLRELPGYERNSLEFHAVY